MYINPFFHKFFTTILMKDGHKFHWKCPQYSECQLLKNQLLHCSSKKCISVCVVGQFLVATLIINIFFVSLLQQILGLYFDNKINLSMMKVIRVVCCFFNSSSILLKVGSGTQCFQEKKLTKYWDVITIVAWPCNYENKDPRKLKE